MLLGGNQDDAVNIAPYPATRPLSFRWPKEVPAPVRTGFKSLPLVRVREPRLVGEGELSLLLGPIERPSAK